MELAEGRSCTAPDALAGRVWPGGLGRTTLPGWGRVGPGGWDGDGRDVLPVWWTGVGFNRNCLCRFGVKNARDL